MHHGRLMDACTDIVLGDTYLVNCHINNILGILLFIRIFTFFASSSYSLLLHDLPESKNESF